MNKAVLLCCGLLAAALLCSSCRREAPPPEASSAPPPSVSEPAVSSVPEPDASQLPESPDPEERFMSHPIPLELPEGEVADGTIVPYTWDYSVTVDNGRQLTLRLAAYTGVVNTNYLCWLWEPENQRFEYAFSLHGYDVRIDPEKQQIVTEDRDASTYTTKTYQYNKDGRLYLADSSAITY